MTLDFKKLVTNLVKKQMSIQHYTANVQVFRKDEMPGWVTEQIKEKFGESYTEDGCRRRSCRRTTARPCSRS